MPLSYHALPGEGQTRACTDPWKFLIVRSNGDVALCCRSPVVGSLKDRSLDEILHCEAAVSLRRELLTGELADHCRFCSERGLTTPDRLRSEIEALSRDDTAELVEGLRMENRLLKEIRAELFRERAAMYTHIQAIESRLRERESAGVNPSANPYAAADASPTASAGDTGATSQYAVPDTAPTLWARVRRALSLPRRSFERRRHRT